MTRAGRAGRCAVVPELVSMQTPEKRLHCCCDQYRRHTSKEASIDRMRVEHALSRVDEFSVPCAVHDGVPTREPCLTLQPRWRPEMARHAVIADIQPDVWVGVAQQVVY
jgi:hypothetical protein